jgi:RNase P/RNase MRP subunit p29
MEVVRIPWLAKTLHIVESSDPSLLGLEGTVLKETKNMIHLRSTAGDKMVSKSNIKFTIDDSEAIDGQGVRQRPENRIHMNWRMN